MRTLKLSITLTSPIYKNTSDRQVRELGYIIALFAGWKNLGSHVEMRLPSVKLSQPFDTFLEFGDNILFDSQLFNTRLMLCKVVFGGKAEHHCRSNVWIDMNRLTLSLTFTELLIE